MTEKYDFWSEKTWKTTKRRKKDGNITAQSLTVARFLTAFASVKTAMMILYPFCQVIRFAVRITIAISETQSITA